MPNSNFYRRTEKELLVLHAIADMPAPYSLTILGRVQSRLGPSRFLRIPAEWRFDVSALYLVLMRLERQGAVTSKLSAETFPELGGRRRRYYRLTQLGRDSMQAKSDG